MATLSREQILSAKDRKTKDIEVADLGGMVRIGAISADTLFKFRDLSARRDRGEQVEVEIVGVVLSGSIMDEDNHELFTEADIPLLMKKSPNVVMTIFQEALNLNNLAPKDDGTGKPVINTLEDKRKNS